MTYPTSQSLKGYTRPTLLYAGEYQSELKLAAAAAVLILPTGKRFTVSQLLTVTTPEEADYHALILGLQKAHKLGLQGLEVKGHSEIVFNQVNGLAEAMTEGLQALLREARRLLRLFEQATVEWVAPEHNLSARKAVHRCLEEATGKKSSEPSRPAREPAIARLIQLGPQATPEDYRALRPPKDNLAQQGLKELRAAIPITVQDAMALQWTGDEKELEQMYRWYLWGLPPDLAIRKVQLDRQAVTTPSLDKLPWEGQLLEAQTFNTLGELSELGPASLDGFTLEEGTAPISVAKPSRIPSLHPLDPLGLPLEAVFPATLHPAPDLADPFVTAGEELDDQKLQTRPKDTLPSVDQVQQILGMIMHLSEADKTRLVQELAQFPEITNRLLTAIANNLKKLSPTEAP
ncbi:reverse transcriptase-like protein [Synechocystis sp. LKSZ1]|uniref:reverse transcriptase-like protein n=1 Tax=Synechocystis sp. LKSZ1 TaxID=3144951 RepID=UPI00336C28E3